MTATSSSSREAQRDRDLSPLEFLRNRVLIIASNRGPVTFQADADGQLRFERGAGGVVTALTGLIQHVEATWIACARTAADALWREGCVPIDGDGHTVRVQFVTPETAAYEGYYHVIANPLLWFLQHALWDIPSAPIINRLTWQAWEQGYKVVNRLFADAIVKQVRIASHPTLVMLQDYHLYLAPRYIRAQLRRRRPTLLHFVHIPWPGPDYWRILPGTMRQAILDSLCAVDVLGFQTREDGLNFMRACEAYLPHAVVNYKRGRIWHRNHATHVRDFPISIDVAALRQLATSPEVEAYQPQIEGIAGGRQLIVRIDRIEPSKNIVRGFQAFEEMLELHPEHRQRVKFLAILIPSRLAVNEYQDYLDELMAAAGRVNARYGDAEWEPIRVLVSENYPRAIAALQRYDVLLVNAIVDGMNLVAKEGPIVNQRDGVLILSERTGAAQQLESGAMVIAPCDVYATAEALHQALTLPLKKRHARAVRLRWLIERDDISAWICWQLQVVKELNL